MVVYDIMLIRAFLQCARYGQVERPAYFRMATECSSCGALLHVLLDAVTSGYEPGILWLICDAVVNPPLASVAAERLTKILWAALVDQKCFSHEYAHVKIVVLPARPLLARSRTSSTQMLDVGHVEVRLIFRKYFADRGMSIESIWLARRRWLANKRKTKSAPPHQRTRCVDQVA